MRVKGIWKLEIRNCGVFLVPEIKFALPAIAINRRGQGCERLFHEIDRTGKREGADMADLQQLHDAIVNGDSKKAVAITQQAIAEKMGTLGN